MKQSNCTGNRRLLLVDDNPAIHEDYRKILAKSEDTAELDELEAAVFGEATTHVETSFELNEALQGEQALEMVVDSLVNRTPFAAAFVDMRMPPGWDGLETIERIWEVDPNLQIVICTAYSDYSWDEIVQRVGMGDRLLILKKPFDPIEVRQLAITLTTKWDLERAAEAAMDSVVNSAADGIVSIQEDGAVESCNPATCKLFERDADAIVGAEFASLICEEDREEVRRMLSRAESAAVPAFEARGLCCGSVFPMLISLGMYATPNGRRCTAILRDLTEYKSLQARLTRAQRLESVGQLAAGVAHEINTPLQYSSDNLEYVKKAVEKLSAVISVFEANLDITGEARGWKDRFDEFRSLQQESKLAHYLAEIPEAIRDSLDGLACVAEIVKAMRELTHPGAEGAVMVTANLNELVENAVRLSQSRWKECAVVETELADGEITIECKPQDIIRVVINLITNAADAIAENAGEANGVSGKILVRTRQTDDGAELTIRDNGPGVSPEAASRIFDPFFTTKEFGKGTGQGLSISHEIIVTVHHGDITCKSSPGQGAEFTVALPYKQPIEKSSSAVVDELVPAGAE